MTDDDRLAEAVRLLRNARTLLALDHYDPAEGETPFANCASCTLLGEIDNYLKDTP